MQAVGKGKSNTGQSQSSARAAASRKRKGGISPPTTLELRGVSIHFPFKPYKCQEAYMEKVLDALLRSENALLESPTGTGKTLCLLCATLAWQREEAKRLGDKEARRLPIKSEMGGSKSKKAVNRVPTIIYASRTHSQLSQVVRELRCTRYRPRHAVLGSREQMCVHPKVKKQTATSSDINHDCNALSKERKCRFRNGLEGFTAKSDDNTQPVLDMEDLVTMGKEHKVCPFYYTRSLVQDAELVLMPYNYLFDKDARETTLQDIQWDNAIVIFDEAHNLESFATDSASFDISTADLAICVAELNRAITYINLLGDAESHSVKIENVEKLKGLFLHFEAYLTNLNKSGAFTGEYMMEIFTVGFQIRYSNHHLFVDEVKKVSEVLMEARGGSSNKGAPKLEHFVQCVKRVFGESSEARCMAKAKSYRVHLSPKGGAPQQQKQFNHKHSNNNNNKHKPAPGSRTLSYWCFAPSLAMQELSSLKLRSILVTSGTLSPLPSYSLELGLPFLHTLENPHIIKDDQIHVRVIGRGVSGRELTSSFQRRKDADYYSELGNTLVSLAKVIPAGMLVFFPSYSVMETCLERWGGPISSNSKFNNQNKNKTSSFFAARNKKGKNNRQQYSFPFANPSMHGSSLGVGNSPITPWKRLLGAKSVVVEPRSTADLPDAVAEFHRYLAMPKSKGVALFGICRGKLAEGIDFSGEQSRAVVITGLPFPPAFDPKVKLKREYLDGAKASKNMKSTEMGGFGGSSSSDGGKREDAAVVDSMTSLSGSAWYNQQAHRACNQAIGRVIRNKDDYGAVLLLDSRYAQPANQKGLSVWVRPHLQKDEGMGVAIGSLAKFYRKAAAQAKEREEAKKRITLEYEQEAPLQNKRLKQPQQADETFTKVAFVQNPQRDSNQSKSTGWDEDTDDPVSYIAPERVLARVDVDKVVQDTKKEPVFKDQRKLAAKKTQSKSTGLESMLASSAASRRVAKPQSNALNNGTTARSSAPGRKLESKQAAALFFKKAQKWLTSAEFSSIRKAIVAMKQHGDAKDLKAYTASAQEVVSLCCQREQFFGRHEEGHRETMLFLFFQLLPVAYRKQVERIAMISALNKSTFGKLCKTDLTEEQRKKTRGECSMLLQWVWCESAKFAESQQKSDFLQRAQKVLVFFQDSNKTAASTLTSSFAKLLPSRFSSSFQALTAELEASRNIQRLKTTESRNKGENAVERIRFQRAAEPKTIKKEDIAFKIESSNATTQHVDHATAQETRREEATSNPPPTSQGKPSPSPTNVMSENAVADEAQRNAPSGSQSGVASTNVVNPYAKKTKPQSLSSYISKPPAAEATRNVLCQRNLPNRPLPSHAPPAYSKKSDLATAPPAYSKKSDAVSDMLSHVESQPFVRKTTGDIVKTLPSNVPANVICVVCSKTVATPLLSECSHMVCKDCWLQWLEKSKTCPVCRVAVDAKSLARVVFQDEYEATAPSWSTLCE